ncbi:hypothetical protein JTP77_043720, partial [Streptomyces sp. S9]|nr:hypothetical protein [Streptomyces sp. S9]
MPKTAPASRPAKSARSPSAAASKTAAKKAAPTSAAKKAPAVKAIAKKAATKKTATKKVAAKKTAAKKIATKRAAAAKPSTKPPRPSGRVDAEVRERPGAQMQPAQIEEMFARLQSLDPHPTTELEYTTAFELLVAVALSAQATDVGVNKATRKLFPV